MPDSSGQLAGWTLNPAGLRVIVRDGQEVLQLRCGGCAAWGDVDDDQVHGRVSVHHDEADDGCGYHETHDFWAMYASR